MNNWKLTTNVIDNKKIYGVYRIINTNETDHSGNREMVGFFPSKEEAMAKVKELNSKGGELW